VTGSVRPRFEGEQRRPGARPRRLRVLYMIGFLSHAGGAERFVLGLSTNLPRERFEPWICAPRGAEPAVVSELAEAGIPLVTLGRRGRWDVHRWAGLPRLLRRQQFDILHTHMFGSNLWGSVAGRACRVPVVIAQEHTWSYEGNPLRAWLDGHVVGLLATRFVAVSSADAERMVAVEGVPPPKVMVIPTAYVPREHPTQAVDLRAELGLSPDTPLFGTAAVMRRQKALDVLIEAHRLVQKAIPTAHLVLAGDGPCRDDLERLVAQLGLGLSTHFLGRRDDVDSIIRALDVGAMSSDFEGTPLFALECMTNRTPLVATAVGGLLDIVEPDRTGILVAPRQPARLAEAITALLLDPELQMRLAGAAATKLQLYSMDAIVSRFGGLYETLVRQAGAG